MSDSNLPLDAPPSGPPLTAVRKERPSHRRSASILELDNPIPSQALNLLWDESAYTLPVTRHNQPLQVTIERVWPIHFADRAVPTLVEYLWNGSVAWTHTIPGPYDPGTVFPLPQDLPAYVTSTGGIGQLSYRVSSPFIPLTVSFPTFLNVDMTPPNAGNPGPELLFDDEALAGVTEDYLTRNAGIPVEVPRWEGISTEDVLTFYLREFPNVGVAGVLSINRAHVEGAQILFTFPEAWVRFIGPGDKFASYTITDRAGNVGPFSPPVELPIALEVLPDLRRPEVPLAELDGLVDLDDVRQGLTVSIRQIDDAMPDDRIFTFWNTEALAPITIGPVQTWPIPRSVPWAIIATGGFDNLYPVRVRYLYQRGTATKNSPDSFYAVDLRVAGPDPIGPDPINPGLERVTVKGVTEDNVITASDAPGPVPVEVRLFFRPVVGEFLELFWGPDEVFAGEYRVQLGDVAGRLITLMVDWAIVSSVSGLEVPVYYWTDNGVNRQRSPSTRVRVEFDTLTGLQSPLLLNDSSRNFIACDTKPEPWEGVFVGVPWNTTHFAIGDMVRLYWKSYPTKNGNGAHFDGTDVWFDHELTSDDRDMGQARIQILPFNPLITRPGLVTDYGSGVTHYRLFKAAGSTGLSSQKLVFIDLKRSGNSPCLGPSGIDGEGRGGCSC